MKHYSFILLTTLFAVIFIVTGCSKEQLSPENGDKTETEDNSPMPTAVSGRIAAAYVTYYGSSIPDPTYITNIFYAYAELYVVNGKYQGFRLQGEESRFASIVALKKTNPSLQISLSFTHTIANSDNSQGGGFSSLAASDEYRRAFAEDCLEFIQKWGIDGIDIDWEFPGISWSGHASDPATDTKNNVLLMKQLRETLGTGYLLSYAGYISGAKATAGGYKYIDIKGVDPYVDFVNIMTYDMDAAPNHHSALRDVSAYCDCYTAVYNYLGSGIKANKLILGIPFYGRHSFSTSPAAISYSKLMQQSSTYRLDNFDESASVPYATLNGVYFCGYDNAKSIKIKGGWANSLGMRGMMYWSYDQDDSKGTLRKAVWRGVMSNQE